MLNPVHLETFCALVDCRSFTAAAVVLHVTQPAVSHHVKALEEELGTPLVARQGRFVTPTAAGDLLYRNAKRLLAQLDQTEKAVRDLRTRTLAVGTSPSGLLPVLLDILSGFAAARRLTLQMRVDEHDRVVRGVVDGSMDMAIIWYPGRIAGVTIRSLGLEQFYLVSSPDGRAWGAAEKSERSTSEAIDGQPFILGRPGSLMHRLAIRWLGQVGVVPKPVLETASTSEMCAAAEQGLGCAILPRRVAEPSIADGRLRVVDIPELTPLLWRELCLAYARPEMQQIADAAVEHVHRGLGLSPCRVRQEGRRSDEATGGARQANDRDPRARLSASHRRSLRSGDCVAGPHYGQHEPNSDS